MATAEEKVHLVETLLKSVDAEVIYILAYLGGALNEDAEDHLKQIHFRITDIKGHLGAVKYALKNQ